VKLRLVISQIYNLGLERKGARNRSSYTHLLHHEERYIAMAAPCFHTALESTPD